MLTTIAGLTTKVVVGAAAVALTGAGAVATMSATGAAAASNPGPSSTAQGQALASSTPKAEHTSEATHEAGDDNGVDASPEASPSPDQATVTRDQAVAIAQALFPAGSLHGVELEGEDGVLVWKVDLRAADGSRAKIWVDATTGSVVREKYKAAKKQHSKHGAGPRSDRANHHAREDNSHHGGAPVATPDDSPAAGSGSNSGSGSTSGSGRGGHDDAPNHS